MGRKNRSPFLALRIAFQYIFIRHQRVSQIGHAQTAVFLQNFCKTQFYLMSGIAFYLHTYPAGHVLTHIQDVGVFINLGNRLWMKDIAYFHFGIGLSAYHSRRNSHPLSRKPISTGFESDLGPTGEFLAGIVFFTIEFVVADNGAVGCHHPAFVAAYRLSGTVFVLNV